MDPVRQFRQVVTDDMSNIPIRRALISVSDKTGLIELASLLHEFRVELWSTGGTRQALVQAGLPVREVSELTHFPEILAGRVKTLHPFVHGGILARRDQQDHMATLNQHGIQPIDLVVCNLYPFERALAEGGQSEQELIEEIDIGGPTLVRAAAKNWEGVAVLTDDSQYPRFMEEIKALEGAISAISRRRWAAEAFSRIAAYDQAIAAWFNQASKSSDRFPESLHWSFTKKSSLRYGENPHQQAAVYVAPGPKFACIAHGQVLHGKELSYNNLLDLDSAFNLVRELSGPAAVVIKHNNPCGASEAETLAEAYTRADAGDSLSAFGGVLGFNRTLDGATAELIAEPNHFVEAIVAPAFTEEALQVLTTKPKWKNKVRLVQVGPITPGPERLDFRRIDGGLLVQTRDLLQIDWSTVNVVTQVKPTAEQLRDLAFAWIVVKHVKSNAIVLVKEKQVIGVGAGQMSRVDSVEIALRKARDKAEGAVLASDAFFPFRDGVDLAVQAGVKAIAQPGGSVRDADIIASCNEGGVAMVFTKIRHFRH